MFKDLITGPSAGNPSDLTIVGSTLYFIAYDLSSNRVLWKSDEQRREL